MKRQNILLISCLSGIATDIYAPSLAAIAHLMNAPVEKAQLSLTIFMVGLSLSQLVYGPLSEGLGRQLPLIIGLVIFTSGSLVCFFATRIELLILGRFIQGLGAGACSSLWRTIFRDVFHGDELTKYGAWLAIAVPFVVPAIPVFGGYFQHYLGWRASFIFLIVYSVSVLLLIIFEFKETSVHHHSERLKASFISQTFRTLLTSRIFMGYTLTVFFCYGAFFSWVAVGPVLLMKRIGLNPVQFGWLSFIVAVSSMGLAGLLNGKLVMRVGTEMMLRLGFLIMFVAGCLLLIGKMPFWPQPLCHYPTSIPIHFWCEHNLAKCLCWGI